MKKKTKTIIFLAIVVVFVIALFLILRPERIEDTITLASATGETVEVDVDILYFSHLGPLSYVKGTVSIDGIEYTDRYTMFKKFPSVKDNRLFPSDWWRRKDSLPYNMTFVRSDCTDIISAQMNRIVVMDIVLDEGVSKIHYMYTDKSNQTGTYVDGVSFWGPAQNAKEAKQIAESFGYKIP